MEKLKTQYSQASRGGGSLEALSNGVSAASTFDASQVTGANLDPTTLGPQGTVGTYEITKLTEEEAIAQGYTVIKTADELKAMGSNGKYILMNDIDLTGVDWTAKNLNAGAEFNGNGYTISNFTLNSTGWNLGFFSTNDGVIENLNMVNANISGGRTIGILVAINNANGVIKNCSVQGTVGNTGEFTGGLVGNNLGRIVSSSVDGVINANTSAWSRAGGLVGSTESTAEIENCFSKMQVNASGTACGGLIGYNQGSVKNSYAEGDVTGKDGVGAFIGINTAGSCVENVSAAGMVTASGNNSGGLVGNNSGTIKNASASGNVESTATGWGVNVGGFVGLNGAGAIIENATASGNIVSKGGCAAGFVGNNAGTIRNASATGNIDSSASCAAGFSGMNAASGIIENSCAKGNASGISFVAGFVAESSGIINNSYALGNVTATANQSGGFVAGVRAGSITNCYAKGDVNSTGSEVGGFIGRSYGSEVITNCYATGNCTGNIDYTGAFVGMVTGDITISDSFATGMANGKSGSFGQNRGTRENCYALTDDSSKNNLIQYGAMLKTADWFEDAENLRFLGDAYDYYYNPPELWGNYEAHPEEFTQFQVGANSGEKHTLNMNMTFRMYDFYGDVTSVDNASATLERVDAFKERLSEHRSMIGSVRNRLDSVLESQSIRLENLNSSHSTIVDTDFAAETAKLTRNQILQQATTSLLAQANFMPQIALQLLQ